MCIMFVSFKIQKGENVKGSRGMQWATEMEFLERERLTFLYNIAQSDRWQSSGQEGELLYAERASRGYRI